MDFLNRKNSNAHTVHQLKMLPYIFLLTFPQVNDLETTIRICKIRKISLIATLLVAKKLQMNQKSTKAAKNL